MGQEKVGRVALTKYSSVDFEETRPTLDEKPDASENDARKDMKEYEELRSEYEDRLVDRYHDEYLVEWGGKRYPVCVVLQRTFSEDQVTERLERDSKGMTRKYVLPEEIRSWGEDRLLAFMKENPYVKRTEPLYDGIMVRLARFEASEGLTLFFEQTRFFDYLRTNLAMDVRLRRTQETLRMILEPGKKEHRLTPLEKSKCANGFGVGCMVKTSDGKFIVSVRSGEVSNAKDTFAPSAGGTVHFRKDEETDLALPPIFEAAKDQVSEEMKVPREQIGELVFLGITRELERGGYPDGHFYAEVNETFENLEKLRPKAEHQEEIRKYLCVEPDKIIKYVTKRRSSPGLRGCVYLLHKAGLDEPA